MCKRLNETLHVNESLVKKAKEKVTQCSMVTSAFLKMNSKKVVEKINSLKQKVLTFQQLYPESNPPKNGHGIPKNLLCAFVTENLGQKRIEAWAHYCVVKYGVVVAKWRGRTANVTQQAKPKITNGSLLLSLLLLQSH